MCRPAVGRGALPALTAWDALVDHAAVQPGQRLMVHGGAGGVGSFVTQLARALGAGVTCTVHAAPDVEYVVARGAERVINTDQEPPSQEMADKYGVTAIFFIVTAGQQHHLARMADMIDMIDTGTLKVSVAATFPLAGGRNAYKSGAIRRRYPGKTVLVVRD